MAATIDALAKCELRSITRFLQAEACGASEVQQRTTVTKEVYCALLLMPYYYFTSSSQRHPKQTKRNHFLKRRLDP